jgi:glutaredoxin
MLDNLEYEEFKGSKNDHDLTMYALSTCGFCKSAIAFLKDKDVSFRYVYVDKLHADVKADAKEKLTERYNKRMLFPFLVVDEQKALPGFDEDIWMEELGIKE